MNFSAISQCASAPPLWLRNERVRAVFYGENGLRAGWRLVIFSLLLGVATRIERPTRFQLFRLLSALTGFHPHRGVVDSPEIAIIGHWPHFLVVLLACWAMSRFERCKLGEYGLRISSSSLRFFVEGCGMGLFTVTAILLGLWSIHAYNFGPEVLHGAAMWKGGIMWGIAFLGVGLNEEYFFRGFVQRVLTTGIGFWPTAVVLSAVFAWFHVGNDGETVQGLIAIFCYGVVFAFIVYRSATLWLAVGFHAAFDWGQTFLYGVPDSGSVASLRLFAPVFHASGWITGGSAGPEASLPAFLVLAVIMAFVVLRFPSRPDRPMVEGLRTEQPAPSTFFEPIA